MENDKNIPGPYSIGSNVWPGLGKVTEECGETLQVIGKLMATHGSTDHWDGDGDLKDRLLDELADLTAAIQFLLGQNDLDIEYFNDRRATKLQRFLTWHQEQSCP